MTAISFANARKHAGMQAVLFRPAAPLELPGRRARPVRLAILLCTALFAVLPFLFAAGHGRVFANQAQAATESSDNGMLRVAVAADPDRLLNLPSEQILTAFSEPELRRMEGNTRVWQYRARDCILDIYFTNPQGGPGDGIVSYYEIRERGKSAGRNDDTGTAPARARSNCLEGLTPTGHTG